MSAPTAALLAACLGIVGCAYWKGRPGGDVAPAAWGDAPAPAAAPVVAAAPAGSIEQRLQNLQTLRRTGVIDAAEYERRRTRLLDDAFE